MEFNKHFNNREIRALHRQAENIIQKRQNQSTNFQDQIQDIDLRIAALRNLESQQEFNFKQNQKPSFNLQNEISLPNQMLSPMSKNFQNSSQASQQNFQKTRRIQDYTPQNESISSMKETESERIIQNHNNQMTQNKDYMFKNLNGQNEKISKMPPSFKNHASTHFQSPQLDYYDVDQQNEEKQFQIRQDQRFNALRQQLGSDEQDSSEDDQDQQVFQFNEEYQEYRIPAKQPSNYKIPDGLQLKDVNSNNNKFNPQGVYETADFYPQNTNANTTNAQSVNSSNPIGTYLQPNYSVQQFQQPFDDINNENIVSMNYPPSQQNHQDQFGRNSGKKSHHRRLSSQINNSKNQIYQNKGIGKVLHVDLTENQSEQDIGDQTNRTRSKQQEQLRTAIYQQQSQKQEEKIFLSIDSENGNHQVFNSMQLMSQESNQRHQALLKKQEYQVMREKESLIYGSQNDANIYSSSATGYAEGSMDNLMEAQKQFRLENNQSPGTSYPISISQGDQMTTDRNLKSINNDKQGLQKLQIAHFNEPQSQRQSQINSFMQLVPNQGSQYNPKNSIYLKSSQISNQNQDLEYSQSRIDQNYDFLTQSQGSQLYDPNGSIYLAQSKVEQPYQDDQYSKQINSIDASIEADNLGSHSKEFIIQQQYNDYQNIKSETIEQQNLQNQVQNEDEYDQEIEEVEDIQNEADEETQRMLSQSLGLQDQEFNDNLKALYQRRINSTKKMMDTISIEQEKTATQSEFINNLRNQLTNNKNTSISQLKIKHHMLVLQLDKFLEEAMDQIFNQEAEQMEQLDQVYKQNQDQSQELESLFQMLELKMRMEKKTKFVQFYPDMMKQCDKAIAKFQQENRDSNILDQNLASLEAPPFDFQISRQKDFNHFLVSQNLRPGSETAEISQNMIIDKSVQCNLEVNQPEVIIISDNQSQRSRRGVSTIDRSELDDQARSIGKQLKHLKKETEYAKKIILNEKKLDHLIGVLDKSKEQIFKNSIEAYEQNQSLIQDHANKSLSKLQRSSSQGGSLTLRGELNHNHRLSRDPQNYQHLRINNQQSSSNLKHNESLQRDQQVSYFAVTETDKNGDRSRTERNQQNLDRSQNRILQSNASVNSISRNYIYEGDEQEKYRQDFTPITGQRDAIGDVSSISCNLMSDDFKQQQMRGAEIRNLIPLRQKIHNLSHQKTHSVKTLEQNQNSYRKQNNQNLPLNPASWLQDDKLSNLAGKNKNNSMFKSDLKYQPQSHRLFDVGAGRDTGRNSSYKNLKRERDFSKNDSSNYKILINHSQQESLSRIQHSNSICNLTQQNSQTMINHLLNIPHTTPNHHNHSINIPNYPPSSSMSNSSLTRNNVSYQNTYAGDYFNKLTKENSTQKENSRDSLRHKNKNRQQANIADSSQFQIIQQQKQQLQQQPQQSHNNSHYQKQLQENDQSFSNKSVSIRDYHQVRKGKIIRKDYNADNNVEDIIIQSRSLIEYQQNRQQRNTPNEDENQRATNKQKIKQKSVKFSGLKSSYPLDQNQSQNLSNQSIRIYLPLSPNYNESSIEKYAPSQSFYECLILKEGKLTVAKFLLKLLRHHKVPSHQREKFYLQIETQKNQLDNQGFHKNIEQQCRTLKADEDLNKLIYKSRDDFPITLYLKVSQY